MKRKLIAAINDQQPISNILISLSLELDEIYFFYRADERQLMIERIDAILKKYITIPIHYVELKDDQQDLETLFKENDDCYVDCGGARYVSLLLFEKALKYNKTLIYYDVQQNCIKNYRQHSALTDRIFSLSIEDVMMLGGGKLKNNMHQQPDLNNKIFCDSVCAIVEKTAHRYSEFTSYVQKVNKLLNDGSADGVTYTIRPSLRDNILRDGMTNLCIQCGLFYLRDDTLVFMDQSIADLFSVSGSFLENYLYIKLCQSKLFDEVRMSVIVDFSNSKSNKQQVVCELDGLVMSHNHLIFISCKSNKVDTYAVNEIKLHSLMFGNELSCSALITLDDLNMKSPSVYAKAKELRVAIIDRTAIGNRELSQQMKAVAEGSYRYEKIGG